MILVDSSVWVDHLRSTVPQLQRMLELGKVACHPFIVGELALGNLKNRRAILQDLKRLPGTIVAKDDEVLVMIENSGLAGRGIGYVDAHLLASARLGNGQLWTRDKRLGVVAEEFGLAYDNTSA